MKCERIHASDCAVNDGPAFLPGPCDCGLDLPVDDAELFRPLLVLGARGGRWDIRQRNIEAFIEAEETPVGNGRCVALTVYLPDAHGWPECGRSADSVDLDDAWKPVIGAGQADVPIYGLNGFEPIVGRLRKVLWLVGLYLVRKAATPR